MSSRPARFVGHLGLTLALATTPVVGVSAQTLAWQGTVSWSRGSYIFTEPTNSFWFSNGLSFRTGSLSLSASLPVVTQNSGVVSFVGGLPLPTGGEDSGAVQRRREGEPVGTRRGPGGGGSGSGMGRLIADDSLSVVYRDSYETDVGDPLLSGSLEVYSGTGPLRSLGFGVSVKAPLRSVDSGVGTGAWDVGIGTSLTAARGRSLLLVDVAWWSFGDLPDLELAPGLMWGAAVSRSFSGGEAAVSATISGASALIETVDAPVSVGVGLLVMPRTGRAISAGASFGLTEAAPDVSVYLGWSLRIIG
jgi:hypothetical protein